MDAVQQKGDKHHGDERADGTRTSEHGRQQAATVFDRQRAPGIAAFLSMRWFLKQSPNASDNYFTMSFQQLTQTPARTHVIFIMGVGMSIRHGAWVFGVPGSLTIA